MTLPPDAAWARDPAEAKRVESKRARRQAQRGAIAVLPFICALLLILAVAPIIVAARARVHRRLIADTIEPARIAASDMEAATLHRLLAGSGQPLGQSAGPPLGPDRAAEDTREPQRVLKHAAEELGGTARRQVADFEVALRGADSAPGEGRSAATLRTETATDQIQAWLDGRTRRERAAALAVERWDVWLPMVLVPLCLVGIAALAYAGWEIFALGRAAERDAAALLEATTAKAALLRGITHDLKNPLGAAQGYTELLAENLMGELAPRPREAVQRVHRLLGVAIATLTELTELARADSGSIALVMAETPLHDLITVCVADHRSAAQLRHLMLGVDPRPGVGDELVIRSDAHRVRQVLDNLVGNAVKYTPAGGAIRVAAERSPDGAAVRIVVSDNGPGIPRAMRSRVFDEFYRLDRDDRGATHAIAGAGIGLAISRRLARLLGGDLWVDEAIGGGACFVLSLPVVPPEPHASGASHEEGVIAAPPNRPPA